MGSWIVSNLTWIVTALAGLTIVLLGLTVWALLKLSQVRKTLQVLTAGRRAASLEQIILDLVEQADATDKEIREIYKALDTVHALAHRGVHRVGFVRFNPFQDLGGDQSFALALLDGENNGVVVSSLHTQNLTRVYAKKVKSGQPSQHPFSAEEKQAIEAAVRGEKIGN